MKKKVLRAPESKQLLGIMGELFAECGRSLEECGEAFDVSACFEELDNHLSASGDLPKDWVR
jgi:hypothetical protein